MQLTIFDAITPHTTFLRTGLSDHSISAIDKPLCKFTVCLISLEAAPKVESQNHPYEFKGIVIINTRFQLNETLNSSGIPCCL